MSKDFATAAGALWSRLAVETGVEASVVVCGHFLGILSALCNAKKIRLIRKVQIAGEANATREQLADIEQIDKDQKLLDELNANWGEVRRKMDVRPGSVYYLTTTEQIQKITSSALEIAIRQDLIDIPDATRFASYRPEGD
ncbi:MAG: hypothetical protein O0X96_05730 [Methanocorpusculum sp.]|nr:hypothetical protein [Methanocorpusculum sp.]MDE2524611.1 hypothetical protein [Methanocorpusculum sp.]